MDPSLTQDRAAGSYLGSSGLDSVQRGPQSPSTAVQMGYPSVGA